MLVLIIVGIMLLTNINKVIAVYINVLDTEEKRAYYEEELYEEETILEGYGYVQEAVYSETLQNSSNYQSIQPLGDACCDLLECPRLSYVRLSGFGTERVNIAGTEYYVVGPFRIDRSGDYGRIDYMDIQGINFLSSFIILVDGVPSNTIAFGSEIHIRFPVDFVCGWTLTQPGAGYWRIRYMFDCYDTDIFTRRYLNIYLDFNKSVNVELSIFKVDEYNIPIPNNPATFQVTKMLPGGNNVSLGDMQTNANGVIEIDDLLIPVGKEVILRIEETIAPDGYIGLDNHFYVKLITGFCNMEWGFAVTDLYTRRANGTTFVSIDLNPRNVPDVYVTQSGPYLVRIFVENEEGIEPLGRFDLEIIKTDIYRAAITNNPATFEVTRIMPGDTPNVSMGEFDTDAEGTIFIPNIPINYAGQELIFRIEETEAPTGFAGLEEHFYITVTFGLHPDNVYRPNVVLTRAPGGIPTVVPNNNIPGVEVTLSWARNTIQIVVENEEAEEVEPEFALRLRQFISEIYTDGTTVAPANREPVVALRNGILRYDHDKTPILVGNGSTVIHTVRVFNEGDIAGFAGKIVGDLPEGVEFLPNHAINQRYEWVMYDANGNTTTDLASAVEVRTRFLSYEQNGQNGRNNLINSFDSDQPIGQMNPHFRDIQIAFRVSETNLENPLNRVIRSFMEVTLNQNEDGERVQGRPAAHYYQDVEYIEIKYFDLELTKWVSGTTVTIDGRTTTTTHQMPADDPGSQHVVAIIPIRRNQIAGAVVDVEYTIRIANRGGVAGIATEITDMIPAQMRLLPEHATNQTYGWEQANNGVITAILSDTIIEPGEYEYIRIVTRWVNEDRNMGLIRNVGIITDSDNELGMLDIDRENDSDDAVILIQPPTGGVQFYMHIIGIVVVVLGVILLLIKRYVL